MAPRWRGWTANAVPSAQTDNESPAPARLNRRHGARTATDQGRHRHRGHVHRRRRLRRGHRRARHHEDPEHPGQPGRRLHRRHRARSSACMGATGDDITAVCHGTTVATNKLLEGKVERLGFITTEGYEFMLEIARQAVPDGYGNSYFWVKPPRIVAGRPRAHRRRPDGLRGQRDPPLRRGRTPSPPPAGSGTAASRRSGSASCTPTPTTSHELAMREVLRREHPEAVVSISSEVLREYREYERSMTTLVDAAVKPNVSRYVANIHAPRSTASPAGAPHPLLRHEVQRRRALGRRGRAPADHDGAVRPGRRRARGRRSSPGGPASTGCSPATAAAPRPTSRSCSTASRP